MSGDLRARIQAALGSNYVVEREIGGGAMGRVFLARDESLGRVIVVKVLSPDDGADVSVERFKREIQVSARLQHANIVPLLTAGEAAGLPYYVMPFVDGESLRARLERGPLGHGEIVGLLKDIARALQYAHGHGIVHRDIKPENVLLSGGAATVADFGIAKALRAAREAGSGTLTSAGTSIGTPAYMAPEQATGDPAMDHRADIYSFGCLAYELIGGQPPFHGGHPHQVIAAHLTDTPPPVTTRRPDCPRPLALLVARCLEKDPARRPQSAREVIEQLDTVSTATGPSRAFTLDGFSRRWIVAAGIVAAAVAAWLLIPRGASRGAAGVQTLTVLPFVAIGGDSAQSYLAEGISEEIATTLAKTRGVRVVGRTAANRFRGRRDVDVRAVGESLGVALVVQGSVRRSGERLRVLAQLTDAASREELWADSYEQPASQVLAVRDQISRAIMQSLRARSGGSVAVASAGVGGSDNADAYDLYLRGQFLLRRRAIAQAADYFERAVAADPGFARAHAGLSTTLALFPYFTGTAPRLVDQRLQAAARRALALDSALSEPHTSLALAHQHAMDWSAAEREHQHAVTLDPSDHEAHLQYGRFLLYVGERDSALAEFRRAQAIDPYSALYATWVVVALWMQREGDAARSELKRAFELDSLNVVALLYGARLMLESGDTSGARRATDRMPRFPPWNGNTAYVLARLGERAKADSIRRQLESERRWFSGTAIAYAYLGLGDTTGALRALERATADGEYWPAYFPLADRPYDQVRASARFRALVRRVGLELRAIEP
jgi:eukaryotic-like serine/threonine-protein kinase